MKKLLFVMCACFILSVAVNAQELFRCTDTEGNAVITTSPQEGMKCRKNEEKDPPSRPSRLSSSTNLVDICSDLSREMEEVNDEIGTLEKRRTELQREQLENRRNEPQDYSSYRRRSGRAMPENERMSKLSKELSVLQQKRSLINQDIRSYKCNELNHDLSKINQKKPEPYSGGGRYRNR